MISQFHLISPVAIVLNVLLALPIAVGLLSGFGVLLFGWVAPPLAAVCGMACGTSLALVEGCVQYVHQWPGSYCWVAGPHPSWCVIFYVGLVLMGFVPRFRPTRWWVLAWLLAWVAAPLAVDLAGTTLARTRPLRCTFLAVGHGTCVVMEMPDGRVVLYDAGRMGIPPAGGQLISSYLWHRGIAHIDALVISHADADHYNAVPELLQRFSVGTVFVSPAMFRNMSPGVEVLHTKIRDSGVRLRQLRAGDVLKFGPQTRLEVFHPLLPGVRGSDNANSLVVEVAHGRRRILLPGDLETPGLEQVIAEMPRDCDVLMAPHHGSLRSSPQEFSRWCTPEWVVISGRHESGHRPSHEEVVWGTQGRVLHTQQDGAITVTTDGDDLQVVTFLGPRVDAAPPAKRSTDP